MKTFSTVGACLILIGILLCSFKKGIGDKITKAEITGFWVYENVSDPNEPRHIKVFEKKGRYYNLGFENGKTIMTHKGKYKILDDSHYKEQVTNVRFNSAWNLREKEFINNYELSKDKKWLVLSGIVYSKNGGDSLKWSHKYRKVEIPE
jgi:hypothetical protein